MVSYAPFFRTIKEKGITQYDLERAGVDHKLLHKLRHNLNITVESLNYLCVLVECCPNDIVEIIRTEEDDKLIEFKKSRK